MTDYNTLRRSSLARRVMRLFCYFRIRVGRSGSLPLVFYLKHFFYSYRYLFYYLRQGGYVFSGVNLFYLLAGLHKNYSTDFHKFR